MTTSLRLIPVVLAGLLLVLAGCEDADAPPADRPGDGRPTSAAPTGADWPAFQGGGPLLGVAEPIGPAPMRVRWTYRVERAGFDECSAAIVGGVAYVGDDAGTLHAVDLAGGEPRWTYRSEDGFGSCPLVADGRVIVGDLNGIVHCVSADDGERLWTWDSGATMHASPNLCGSGVLVVNDLGRIACLDPDPAADKRVLWEARGEDRINGSAAVADGQAWLADCVKKLRTYDAADGSELLVRDMADLSGAAPLAVDGRIVLGLYNGTVACYDAGTGEVAWTYAQVDDGAMVYSSAAAAEGMVVVGARDKCVHGIDLKTGERRWVFETRGAVDSSPAISGGRVYVGSKDRRLYVLDLKTGAKLWEFVAGRGITASPAIGGGVVVVGDTAGNLYCLEPAR